MKLMTKNNNMMTSTPAASTSASVRVENGRRGGGAIVPSLAMIAIIAMSLPMQTTRALSASSFHGSQQALHHHSTPQYAITTNTRSGNRSPNNLLVMRKQKASDKRTARMQRGKIGADTVEAGTTFTPPPLSSSSTATQILRSSPMTKNQWKDKKIELRAAASGSGGGIGGAGSSSIGGNPNNVGGSNDVGGGRGRARKRMKLYNSLASYHSTFLGLISEEYRMEEAEVITRLEASISDPFLLETSGHALFDIHPQRRGNIFNDEVYRLEKSRDATTTFFDTAAALENTNNYSGLSPLPPNHKFSRNDVAVVTLQPRGTGDFLGVSSLPTQKDAASVEARILNVGPTYVDVAIPSGKYEAKFGPASNNRGPDGRGDPNLRVRVDRFFSDVPFRRMVAALGQLTSVPAGQSAEGVANKRIGVFQMDNLLKEAVLSTFAIKDDGMLMDGMSNPSLGDLPKKLAKPPLPTSTQLANQVMTYIQSNPSQLFPQYNEPQLTAIRAALTRRLTLIQGPPGTGKTTTAASIAFGFVHQCRSLSPHTKVLATAFSNVGADNLAEKFLTLGLKVVRVGKPSGVSESLWSHTLDAAIGRDPMAQKALEEAKRVTARVKGSKKVGGLGVSTKRMNKGALSAERAKRDAATDAVKASILACNIAATRALREADVIVATSIGAADAQLLAACGIYPDDEDDTTKSKTKKDQATQTTTPFGTVREFAPDNLPPLSTPFVIIDEACQSVEPASLVPIVSTNSCRALVMLGDPCQLPPTVRSDASSTGESPLSVSLMSRLASALPSPVTITAQKDNTPLETRYLQSKPMRQAVSKVAAASDYAADNVTYRKQYAGSLLLSVQYRMHPSIAAFSSAVFYNGLLSSPLTLNDSRKFPRHINARYASANSDVSVRFIQVGGRNNESKGAVQSGGEGLPASVTDPISSNNSYRNDAEARQVVRMLISLLNSKDEDAFRGSIGVVTPYSGQVALIKSMMAKDEEFRTLAQSFPHEIEVKSVDAYQGRERDLIIFSTVRSNHHGRIGFLTDWRRMNVALTRAKNGLVVFGDAATLKEGDKHWGAFVQWCENMGCFVDEA